MNMKRNERHFLFFLLIALFLYSKSVNAQVPVPTFSDQIINSFSKQYMNLLQEKVYLQTDKPYYSAGEDIWFKAYLLNSTTLENSALSKFVYVELIDKRDSVLYRVKIKNDMFGFSGHITLKLGVQTGYYSLRAYTYWMQNLGRDFFFKKTIFIGNTIDDRFTSHIVYGDPVGGFIPVSVEFTNSSHEPIRGKKVELVQNWKSADKKKFPLVTDDNGKIGWQMKVDSKDNSKKSIDVSFDDEKYKSTLYVPEFNSEFDVQFFPESGVMLNNVFQTIAFKVIGKNGLSTSVFGKVFNNKKEEVADITTLNKGMGKFVMQTHPGETYYAIVKSGEGIRKRFELPKSHETGVVMRLVYNKGKIMYEVTNNTNIQDKSLYLLLHSRGKVYAIQSLRNLRGQISESLLPAGIASLSVIDSLGYTYCERLTFVRNFNLPVISMESNKLTYSKHELVDLNLNLKSALGKAIDGNFSISVTDSHVVKQDSLADNILTNLLLTSDIKGYVEDPGSYFVDNTAITREKTDVLMLTQGWHRFNTADVVKSVNNKPKFYAEAGQVLSGKVKNILNGPVKRCDVVAISSSYRNMFGTSKTDSLGRFLISGIEFPDSTSFVLKANKAGSFADVEIIPDVDNFPDSESFIPVSLKANTLTDKSEYFKQSREKYYNEGGMWVISLNEVTVKARKNSNTNKSYYTGMGDSQVTTEQLELYKNLTLMNLLMTLPGVQVNGDKISIRGSSPLILIDDMEVHDISEFSYLTAKDLASVDVFKGANTIIFGSRGANGVIAITLKKYENVKSTSPLTSVARIMPLGYQKPVEFYAPKYAVGTLYRSQDPDLRTTIYWNPKLVADKNGNIHVSFYAADKANNYTVIVEGVSNAGEICRYVGVLRREDK